MMVVRGASALILALSYCTATKVVFWSLLQKCYYTINTLIVIMISTCNNLLNILYRY